MTRFEIKKFDEDEWQEVTEKTVMEKLAEKFDPVTPVIFEMLQGKEIITPHEIYRIKI